MSPAKSPPQIVTLVLLTSVSVLSLNMFLPSMGQIAEDLEAEYALVSLALGGYLAVSAVLQLILGPISDRVGRRPVMLAGMAVFTLASVGCALAQDIWVFLAFRMVQCAVGVGMVLSRAVVRDTAPPQEAARRLAVLRPVRVKTSFLGAHAVPPDYKGRPGDYLEEVCLPALRAAHAEGLVDAVDGFCEGIAFSVEEMAVVFDEAARLGLPIKLHAEQLSNLGGAKMAAERGALSSDHLEYATAEDAAAMAAGGSVAVLLPGAFYTLRETHVPPVAAFREAGVPMAVATDLNPGSSPMNSLLLAMNMACTLFRMTPEEALAGTTRHAARALGLSDAGTIEAGRRGDLAVWNAGHPAELSYRFGFNPLHRRYFAGAA